MESIFMLLRERILSSAHATKYFEKEISRVAYTIRDTVINGVSNSLLIIGRRGSGKSHLLREALEKVKLDSSVKGSLVEAHINGLIHTDDRMALHAIAKQLQRACSDIALKKDLPNFPVAENEEVEDGENDIATEGIRMRSFVDQLQWLLAGLRAGSNTSKALLVVVEEFDLFAVHRNQALLYNLLDVTCHAGGTPICVIGVTCRLDIMELLEKRVKSRFSHRHLHVIPVTAPHITDDSTTGSVGDPDNNDSAGDDHGAGRAGPFQRYCLLAASLLRIDDVSLRQLTTKLQPSDRKELIDAVARWNFHVEAFFEDDLVRDCLRQTWEVSTCVRKLVNAIALLVARLDSSKPQLNAGDFISVVSKVCQDAKTSLMLSLSLLELFLVTTMVKLHDIHEGQLLNFEIVFSEYSRFCKSSCPAYLYEKRVVSKAMDNLVQLELVVCGHEAVANVVTQQRRRHSSTRSNVVAAAANLPDQLRRFQPIVCFVSLPSLTACLDAYPGCPTELTQWAHSRTMKCVSFYIVLPLGGIMDWTMERHLGKWLEFRPFLSVKNSAACVVQLLRSFSTLFFAVVISTAFACIGYLSKSKSLIWIATLLSFWFFEQFVRPSTGHNEYGNAAILQGNAATILLRASSIGLEYANSSPTSSSLPNPSYVPKLNLRGLRTVLTYTLYPPTFLFGPLVLFSDWCALSHLFKSRSHVSSLHQRSCLPMRILSCNSLMWRGLRLTAWFLLWELILHVVYPNALVFALTQPVMQVPLPPLKSGANQSFHASPFIETDRSAPGVAVYLLGMQFFFTYLQLYGWPRWLSDLEILLASGIGNGGSALCLVPEGPLCFSHILLFSQLWRKFDQGLYNYLKWYVYLPWLKRDQKVSAYRRIQAGVLAFLFVLLFHSLNLENTIWVSINLTQSSLEQLFKWIYRSTRFGMVLQARLSQNTSRRLAGILCSISAMFSSVGFFFFYLGFDSGIWIFYLMFSDPVYLSTSMVLYYCTYQIAVEVKRFSKAGLK
ncbi:Origin recognition complex subunit 4 [Taenia crassiceps]|uniref:Origin recognition complex subunit 4 n=1 Tax=Taenia crassiceps TaxID=6207 RepID=A0ABR4QRC8_9CEST